MGIFGCSSEPVATEDIELDFQERIIGGFPARSPHLDAIGALGYPLEGDVFQDGAESPALQRRYVRNPGRIDSRDTFFPYCTGTLIAPNAVLTAEHCISPLYGDEEFLLGFDATNPRRSVKIIGAVAETSIEGGFVGLGSDLAVAILEEPILDIAPLPYRTLSQADVGQSYVGIGYGYRNNAGDAGQRYLGQMRLQGLGGNHALNIWGSLERYLEEFPNLGIADDPLEILPLFDLLQEYEASVGNAPGNAQDCYGDSGGPLARFSGGRIEVFGVVSGGVGSLDLVCDWGGVYATLGPAALETIERALGCGAVPLEGACQGLEVVARCAPPEEGGYRVVETDCSLAGLICGEDEAGELGCVPDPCEGIPEEGYCDGDLAIRCSEPGEGTRRVLEIDCSLIGGSCGFDDADEVACLGATSGSCQGNCGGSSTAPDGSFCFCDDACQFYGDCCADYLLVCEPPPAPLSCAGNCGEVVLGEDGAFCSCLESCFDEGSCCTDYFFECEDTGGTDGPDPTTTTAGTSGETDPVFGSTSGIGTSGLDTGDDAATVTSTPIDTEDGDSGGLAAPR